jgi:hypothetical protein
MFLIRDPEDIRRVDALHALKESGLSLTRVSLKVREPDHRWLTAGGRAWYPTSISAALEARERGFPPYFIRHSANHDYLVWHASKMMRASQYMALHSSPMPPARSVKGVCGAA